MTGKIAIDFFDNEKSVADEPSAFDIEAEMAKIDEAFAEACLLFSDELWDGCMNMDMKKIERGSQTLGFQRLRTPGINSKLIHYGDLENRFGVIFSKSVLKGEDSFRVMQAFRFAKTPGQPCEIIYPFGIDRPSESTVMFLKKICEGGLCGNFR